MKDPRLEDPLKGSSELTSKALELLADMDFFHAEVKTWMNSDLFIYLFIIVSLITQIEKIIIWEGSTEDPRYSKAP